MTNYLSKKKRKKDEPKKTSFFAKKRKRVENVEIKRKRGVILYFITYRDQKEIWKRPTKVLNMKWKNR